MKKVSIFLLLLVLALSAPAFAGTIEENAASDDYVLKLPAMLLRGTANVILAPVEAIVHIYNGTINGTPVVGTLEGAGEGIVWTLDRAGRGIWDILTAPFPNYNGAPPSHELEFVG